MVREPARPFASLLAACIVAASAQPSAPESEARERARRWWASTPPDEKRALLVRACRLALLAIALAVDTEGKLWLKETRARPQIDDLIRRFDARVFAPFAAAHKISPDECITLRQELGMLCRAVIEPGYLKTQIDLAELEDDLPSLATRSLNAKVLTAIGLDFQAALLLPCQDMYSSSVIFLTSCDLLAAVACYALLISITDTEFDWPVVFNEYVSGAQFLFEGDWPLIIQFNFARDQLRPLLSFSSIPPSVLLSEGSLHFDRLQKHLQEEIKDLLAEMERLIHKCICLKDGREMAAILGISGDVFRGLPEQLIVGAFYYSVEDKIAFECLRADALQIYNNCKHLYLAPIGLEDKRSQFENVKGKWQKFKMPKNLNSRLNKDVAVLLALLGDFSNAALYGEAWWRKEPCLGVAHNQALIYLDWAAEQNDKQALPEAIQRWWEAAPHWAQVLRSSAQTYWQQRGIEPGRDFAGLTTQLQKCIIGLTSSWGWLHFADEVDAQWLYGCFLKLLQIPDDSYSEFASVIDVGRNCTLPQPTRNCLRNLQILATDPYGKPGLREELLHAQNLFLSAEYPLKRIIERHFPRPYPLKGTPPGGLPMSSFQAHALVVGIAQYQYLSALSKTITDAQDIRDLLIAPQHCGYPPQNVTLLLDKQASRTAISGELARLAQTAPETTVLIYFSGHGIRSGDGPAAKNYLSAYETDLGNLEGTAISGESFADALRAIPAQKVIVFLDVCHAGGIGQPRDPGAAPAKGGLADSYYQKLAEGSGRVIIASCKDNQVSFEFRDMRNGLFTTYLLEALRGQADVRGDGYVHVLDVAAYLTREVPQRQPDQQPVFHCVSVDQNFPVAIAPSRSAVPSPTPATPIPAPGTTPSTPLPYGQVDTRRLLKAMEDSLSAQDFELLCFMLEVKSAFLPGQNQGLQMQFLGLIQYLKNRGYYDRLVEEFLNMRPNCKDSLFS